MTWSLRDAGNEDGPIYTSGTDLFTIKIHGGGHLDAAYGTYVGGGYRYVDNCDADEISILELDNMLEEAFGSLGYTEICYKLPHIEGVCTKVDKDVDLLAMYSKLGSNRLVYVYAVTLHIGQTQQIQEFRPSHVNYDYFESMNPYEREELEQLLLLENMQGDFGDVHDFVNMNEHANGNVNEHVNENVEPQVISDGKQGSFHDDSSNMDSTDDEVCAVREKRRNVKKNRMMQT